MIAALMFVFPFLTPQDAGLNRTVSVTSTVRAVTVYSDRASIQRAFTVALDPGIHKVVVSGLSEDIDDRTIRVSGVSEGRARILDVAVEPIYTDTIPHDRVRVLSRQLQELRDEEQQVRNKRSVVEGQMGFVDSLEQSYLRSIAITQGSRVAVEEWERASRFIEQQRTSFYSTNTALNKHLREIDAKVEVVLKEMRQYSGSGGKNQKKITITMDATERGTVSGNLSYVLAKASWTPMYDVRISTLDSSAQLTIAGSVTQWTQEDWEDVDLTLSTAQPSLGAAPEPMPWYVDSRPVRPMAVGYAADLSKRRPTPAGPPGSLRGRVVDENTGEPLVGASISVEGTSAGASTDANGMYLIQNLPVGSHTIRASYIGYTSNMTQRIEIKRQTGTTMDFGLVPTSVVAQDVVVMGQRPSIQRNTTNTVRVDVGVAAPMEINLGIGTQSRELTSTSFHIVQPVDVPADNAPHQTTIAIETVPVALRYVTVPGISPHVYQEAHVINSTEYPLIDGTANVFADDAYVLSTPVPLTLAKDTLNLSVGVDDAFRASRTEVSRFTETVGTFSRKTRVNYEIRLEVRSSRPTACVVEVKESMPVTRTENIEVEILEPVNAKAMMDEKGILTWRPLVESAGRKELTLKYWIQYPRP